MVDVIGQEQGDAGLTPGAATFTSETESLLGRTLVSLLDEAVERNPNPAAFRQQRNGVWESLSTEEFRSRALELAVGLGDLGLRNGDRVAFFCHSDTSFILPDMACLMAGLVTVPIYLTHAPGNIRHILKESGARALVVTDGELLDKVRPLSEGTAVEKVILMEGEPGKAFGLQILSAQELTWLGSQLLAADPTRGERLLAAVDPQDLATIIYTSGTTGTPKGVMLTHENISSNAIGAFRGLEDFPRGPEEISLSFLPLTHIFARMLNYGFMWYGTSVWFSDPDRLSDHFKEVRPTLLATVPRVLERAFEKIMVKGSELEGAKRRIFDWSVALARRYRVDTEPSGAYALSLRVADKLVYSKWREALGGRLRFVIVGAAALRPELANIFGAAGIHVLQGYGLTETSPVVSFNRKGNNRAGTVGTVIDGVEVRVSDEGEILVRGPGVMRGYYLQDDETAKSMIDGWFRTGDLGELDGQGFITLTGRLKNLFKLSTGKYVMPQYLEQELEAHPLIDYALVVGDGEKYCSALLFLNEEAIRQRIRRLEPGKENMPMPQLLRHPRLHDKLRRVVQAANAELPAWSNVKRVGIAVAEFTAENGFLTPTLKIRRKPVLDAFAHLREALYRPKEDLPEDVAVIEVVANGG